METGAQKAGSRSWLWALPVFLCAFLLVLLVAGGMALSRERKAMEAFTATVNRGIEEAGASARIVLATLAGYQRSVDSPDLPGLATLARTILAQNRSLHSILYFSWVPLEERAVFEQEMRRQGLPGFRIRAAVVRLGKKEGYLPAILIEPLTPESSVHLGNGLVTWTGSAGWLPDVLADATPVPLREVGGAEIPSHGLAWVHAVFDGRRAPGSVSGDSGRFSGLFMVVVDMNRLMVEWQAQHPDYRLALETPGSSTGSGTPVWGLGSSPWEPLRLRHVIPLSSGDLLHVETRLGMRQLGSAGVFFIAAMVGVLTSVFFLLWRSQRYQRLMAESARRALDRERERAHKTLHAIGDMVLVVDANWKIRYVNPTGKRLLRWPVSEILDRPLEEVVKLQDVQSGSLIGDLRAHFLSQSAEGELRPVRLVGRDGVGTAIDSRVSPLTFPDGNDGMVIVMRDVSMEHELLERLAYQASHDMLTGLYNRNAFEGWIREALAESEVQQVQHAMIYLDLDRFKLINDTCGHAAGDELLKLVAAHIREVLRAGDLLARVGGDEFGILLRQCELGTAENIAKRILASIENFRFRWEDKLFQVHASIGVVSLGREDDTLKEVLMAADLACHVAKERGRNRIHVHAVEDVSVHHHHQEMQWLPRLQEALDNDRFVLFMQPIRPLDEGSGLPVMNEFLIRLRTADGKLLPPGLFIPAAERYDLMWQIDRWMVENAVAWLRDAEDSGDMLYTINLSAQTFSDRSFSEFVKMTLESYGVDAGRICFELTETAAVTNITVAGELMQALKELGCRILLDDFGSGLSSFGYLKRLPIDYLKIDGQFVRDILTDPLDKVMVRMCQELARVLQVRTVAEFIESREILEAVKAIGIDYGQGYHLGRPSQACRVEGEGSRALG